MSAFSRPVKLLLCGLLLLTISMAVLNTLVPLWLTHGRLPTWSIGIVGSAFFMGNLLGTLIAGQLINRSGFNRSYYYAAILFAVSTLGLTLSVDFISWLVWRMLAGVACALIWVIVESALLRSGTIQNRSQLLAAYMIVYYIGTVIGQLLIASVPTQLMSVVPWVIVLMGIAILPMLFAPFARPDQEHHKTNLLPMLRLRSARLGINGCIISGIVLGSLYGLLPLFFSHQGMSDAKVGYWMALMVGAGIVGQWPVGWMADRYGRLLVLRVQVFMVILGCLVMVGASAASGYLIVPALFVLGCAGFTLYPIAMAWACEKVNADELVAMNQALLMSYTIGSLIGPSMTGILMQHYSDKILFIAIAAVALVYMMMLFKKADHHHTPMAAV